MVAEIFETAGEAASLIRGCANDALPAAQTAAAAGARMFAEVTGAPLTGAARTITAANDGAAAVTVRPFNVNSFFFDPAKPESTDSVFATASRIGTQGVGLHDAEGFLEPGIHRSTMSEFSRRLGFTASRRQLIDKALPMFDELGQLGLDRVYVGGSFVTSKLNPGDIDMAAVLKYSDNSALWHRAVDLSHDTKSFGQHLFIAQNDAGLEQTNMRLLRFTRQNREVGIVELNFK